MDANGRPLLEFHFRVQFYIESPVMLRDETSRHNYFLQLKSNTVNQEIPKDCSDQSLIKLGALALQADFGDIDSPTDDYSKLSDYLPHHLRNAWNISALQTCHKDYRGMSRADAETNFIKEACALNEVINAHVFRMKLTKNEPGPGSVLLIIYAKGIKILGEHSQTTTFTWPNISKLCFERKKFEIKLGESKTVLYSSSDTKNKKLFSLCKDTHQFSMKIATRLNDAIRREEEESSSMHTCDMYSHGLNLPYKNKSDQRISVISSTSSNTTSGIVSDRVHSEDELEIMINSPPAIGAPSTESLALAHLLEKPSVSRQTSSVSRMSLKGLENSLSQLSADGRPVNRSISNEFTPDIKVEIRRKENSTDTDSPNSQHNMSSQCSSTCSTIVVTSTETTPTATTISNVSARRRPSTSSSLELGFSHTAQNSAISESTANSAEVSFSQNNEEEDVSGVYTVNNPAPTETSGVYTMSTCDVTTQSSEIAESESHGSSYFGCMPKSEADTESIANVDSVDGREFKSTRPDATTGDFRLRTDSSVSSSSFRGDGSDPTDKKQTLLSAEELTDLIVGRGSYPSRKTVSDTLDSDCDYVTMPIENSAKPPSPIPIPPKRVDSNTLRPFSGLVNNVPRSCPPPPYNSRHGIASSTDALESHVHEDVPAIPLRDPPPYPQQPIRTSTQLPLAPAANATSICSTSTSTQIPEEAAARFITTRPQINILKAHTSMVGDNAKPSYAAPTIPPPPPMQAQPSAVPHTNHLSIPSTIGIPIIPYNLAPSIQKMTPIAHPPPPPYPEVASSVAPNTRACVLLPVIKSRQYLQPPPPTLPRQPPPPPPASQLATVYTSQLARSQIELYQQQLYSDVDYVIYPLQDPAVSQQEYLDAKQGSILAAMAQSSSAHPCYAFHTGNHHQPSWDACKTHTIYRSTPYLSMAYPSHSRYASTQNLSDTYVQLPSGAYSPLYSPSIASLCSSYDVPPPPPLRPRPVATAAMFTRSKSDDNILNSIDAVPKSKRLPPPPPPPYNKKKPPMPAPIERSNISALKSAALFENRIPWTKFSTLNFPDANRRSFANAVKVSESSVKNTSTTLSSTIPTTATPIDINILRERSKHLDLPLISALCNDRTLIKQTKAFILPKYPKSASNVLNTNAVNTLQSSKGKHTNAAQISKPKQKTAISHRHPNDKLPPLPMQTTEGNNYVMDPTPTAIKHKSFSSQPNLKQI